MDQGVGDGGTPARRVADASPLRGRFPRSLRAAVAILAVAAAITATLRHWPSGEGSLAVQGVCVLGAVVVVVALGCRWPHRRARPRRRALVGVLLLLLVAFALRLAAQRILPPPDQTAFEEIQMGGDAYRFLAGGGLKLQFRFTTLMAAAGFAVGGTQLAALRAPFKLAGLLVLLFLLLTLRHLAVSWPIVVLVVVVAATLRWFVIAAGCADEMFAPMLWVAMVLWLLAADDGLAGPSPAVGGALGVLGAVLLYEHAAYLPVVALAGGSIIWRAAASTIRGVGPVRAWAAPALFVGAALITACPLLGNLIREGSNGVALEPFHRHLAGREVVWSDVFPVRAWHYLVALGGGPVRGDEGLAVTGKSAVPQPFGALLLAASLAGLVVRRRPLLRAMVVAAVGGIAVAGAVARNVNVARMSGLLLLLLVPLGCVLDDAMNWIARRLPARRLPGIRRENRVLAIALAGTLGFWLVAANIASIRNLLADPRGRAMYTDDEYAVSVFIARTAIPGQTVVLWTPDRDEGWAPAEQTEMVWLLKPKRLRIVGVTRLPEADALEPGTLVVAGVQRRALSEGEFGALERLADATGSRRTLTSSTNFAGARSVAAFCVRCP
jgi:hypothetical protein